MAHFSLEDFSRVGDETLMNNLMKPLIGQVSVIEGVTNNQTNVILNGADGKKITLVIHKSRDEVYENLKFRQKQYILLRGFGLKALDDGGPLALTWETGCAVERIGQTSLSNLDLFEENGGICSGVVVLKSFSIDYHKGCLIMNCSDLHGQDLLFTAYNSHSGNSMLSTTFYDILKSNQAQSDDIIKISNFCVIPAPNGNRQYRLRKDSKVGFIPKMPVHMYGNGR
ncbi:hypothetical protein QR680_016713 [Steinernema hermaphroditum]|uniref:Uncharacterized protein n=1 Tax=Steinernema hermaphroditum TaxID=289476 RepID=A0AA39HEI4_9BILA|nr:hypothetical protein QR680_016713 [Steinernema hermaphroditum]